MKEEYQLFAKAQKDYKINNNLNDLLQVLRNLFSSKKNLQHLFIGNFIIEFYTEFFIIELMLTILNVSGFKNYLKKEHVPLFEKYTTNLE